MRRLLPLVVLVAACTGTAGDTTTMAPIVETSTSAPTTSTTEPSSTTTEPTVTTTTTAVATTTVDGCVERNGVLRNPEGLICPPTLAPFVLHSSEEYLPGIYETRLFTPRFRIEVSLGGFPSDGEASNYIEMPFIRFHSGALAEALVDLPDSHPTNRPDGWEWVVNRTTTGSEIGGYPASVTEFDTVCAHPDSQDSLLPDTCRFSGLTPDQIQVRGFPDDAHVMHVVVEHPTGPIVISVYAPNGEDDDDIFWAKILIPILDSIEFLDQ